MLCKKSNVSGYVFRSHTSCFCLQVTQMSLTKISENTRGSRNVKHKFLTAYFAFKSAGFPLHVLLQTS